MSDKFQIAYINHKRLRWAREKAGLNVYQLALKMGQHPRDVSKWEEGNVEMTISQAHLYAECCEIPVLRLYYREFPVIEEFIEDNEPKYCSFCNTKETHTPGQLYDVEDEPACKVCYYGFTGNVGDMNRQEQLIASSANLILKELQDIKKLLSGEKL